MVTVVPMAAIAAVLGIRRLAIVSAAARVAFALAGGVLLILFLSWNFLSIRGLKATGGVGPWSDAIEDVTATLRSRADGNVVWALTWGLANNAFVLSRGAVRMDEMFVSSSQTTAPDRRPWRDVIRGGGFFLIGGVPSAAKTGFRNALPTSDVAFRKWTFRERSGALYTELFQVFPAESPQAGKGSDR
jgi:hypothetical protein